MSCAPSEIIWRTICLLVFKMFSLCNKSILKKSKRTVKMCFERMCKDIVNCQNNKVSFIHTLQEKMPRCPNMHPSMSSICHMFKCWKDWEVLTPLSNGEEDIYLSRAVIWVFSSPEGHRESISVHQKLIFKQKYREIYHLDFCKTKFICEMISSFKRLMAVAFHTHQQVASK